jgi:hypothetical protein
MSAAKPIDSDKFASVLFDILSDMSASELLDRLPTIYDVVAEHFSEEVVRKVDDGEDEHSGIHIVPNFVLQKHLGE